MKKNKSLFFLFLITISGMFYACNDYDGNEITMYYSDSIPKIEVFYKYYGNSKKIMKEIRYFPNGEISSEGKYNDAGNKTGEWISYFDNGKKWHIDTYVNGKKSGKVIEWYKSGKKMYEADYQNDLPNGKWIIYDEMGKKISTTTYKDGQIVD